MPVPMTFSKKDIEAAPWVRTAALEIGVKEKVGRASNPRIDEYLGVVGMSRDDTPWCAAFVNWTLAQNKMAGTNAANARSFEKWGKPTEPRFGAITVLKRGNSAWQGHVGFLVKWDDTYVWLLGGNQGDAVNVTRFPRSSVIAMRWPRSAFDSRTMKTALAAFSSGAPVAAAPAARKIEEAAPSTSPALTPIIDAINAVPPYVLWGLAIVSVAAIAYLLYHTSDRVREEG